MRPSTILYNNIKYYATKESCSLHITTTDEQEEMANIDGVRKPKLLFYQSLLLEGAYNVVGKSVAAPIERVKLILQNQNELVWQGRNITYQKGITSCIINIVKQEGPAALWRGEIFCFPTFLKVVTIIHMFHNFR